MKIKNKLKMKMNTNMKLKIEGKKIDAISLKENGFVSAYNQMRKHVE